MDKEHIIKKIVVKAFEKARKECSENSKTAWSKHIKYKIDTVIDTRTFTRAYNKYVESSNKEGVPKSETINDLCMYLGHDNYTSFVKAYSINLLIDKMSYESLFGLADIKINELIIYLSKEEVKKNIKSYFWLGVLLLKVKQYNLAIQNLEKCIELNPVNEEYHYNLALAKFKGKRPFLLKNDEIKSILNSLNTALRLNPQKEKLYYLKYIIQEDYYKRRGFEFFEEEIQLEDFKEVKDDKIESIRLLNTIDKDLIPNYRKHNLLNR